MNNEKKDVIIPTVVGGMAGAIAAISYHFIISNPKLKKYVTSLAKDIGEKISQDIKSSVIQSLTNEKRLTSGNEKKDRG